MIQLTRQVPSRVVVDRCRVLKHYEVKPSAPAFPAGRYTPFATDLLQFLAIFANVLCLEDALAYPCLVPVSGAQSQTVSSGEGEDTHTV
jgi:hypothetical protein